MFFDYDGMQVPAAAPNPIVRTIDASRIIRRDSITERELLEKLHRLGFRTEWSLSTHEPVLHLTSHLFPRVVRTLLADRWHVEAAGVTYRSPGAVDAPRQLRHRLVRAGRRDRV